MSNSLRWSREPPTEPGWYWVKDHVGTGIVEVVIRPGHRYLAIYEDSYPKGNFIPVAGILAEWAGPIPEPEESTS
jgi:hypothetical protein